MRALRVSKPKHIVFVTAPKRSRGCAEVAPGKYPSNERSKVVIAVASPSNFRIKRLANLMRHELLHTQGWEHDEMSKNEEWSLGNLPNWAKRFDTVDFPKYLGRAPNQME